MIKIHLARQAAYSRVEINGIDISDHVRGVSVSAEVGAITIVKLELSDEVEIDGDPAVIEKLVTDKP